LLTQRLWTSKIFPGAWVLPGGHLDPKETTFVAALREVKEEVGLNIAVESSQK
jgi:8-oxo-dGTP diphosphatase